MRRGSLRRSQRLGLGGLRGVRHISRLGSASTRIATMPFLASHLTGGHSALATSPAGSGLSRLGFRCLRSHRRGVVTLSFLCSMSSHGVVCYFSLTFEYLIFFCVAFLLHLIVWLLLVVVLECVGTLEWLVVDRLDDFCLD